MEDKKNNKSGYIDGNKHKYASFEKDLLATKTITRLSGNLKIDIDPYDKLIYMTMRDSFYGYKNAGLEYYEDQTDIAAAAGVSASKLKKSIKKWQSLGLITVKTIRTARGNKSNAYIVTSFSDVHSQYSLECPERFKGKSGDATPNLKHEATPQEEQHAMVLQPAKEHEPAAVRPPNTPERDRDMDLDLDELLEPQGNENGRKQGEPPQEDREQGDYRVTRTPVPIPTGINPDDPDSWDECPF